MVVAVPWKDQVMLNNLLMTGVRNLRINIGVMTKPGMTDINKTTGMIGMMKVETEATVVGIGHVMTNLRENGTVTLRISQPEAEAP